MTHFTADGVLRMHAHTQTNTHRHFVARSLWKYHVHTMTTAWTVLRNRMRFMPGFQNDTDAQADSVERIVVIKNTLSYILLP